MQVVHEVCCGLDVHKKSVTACVLWAVNRRQQTQKFGRFTRELLELADWLRECGVTHVALESTNVYGKPVGLAITQAMSEAGPNMTFFVAQAVAEDSRPCSGSSRKTMPRKQHRLLRMLP